LHDESAAPRTDTQQADDRDKLRAIVLELATDLIPPAS
jgi:hypothetical protein